ncbi:hypothetical protein FQR65_LT14306 [Abscondita terminalis]|nr:hypothetical protein FQR65_LT14306 [Abscondita terminalis]
MGVNDNSTVQDAELEKELKSSPPLILTPYIESGNIEEARKLSEVKYEETEDVKSYSGYFTVNEEFNSNLFFWFFPSETDYKNAPVLLWLQGGPGSSSLLGALIINGAFEVTDDLKLRRKSYYWSQTHSVLYIDNPVGTGFSFTDEGGYTRNQTTVGEHLYAALLQFFKMFPELQENDFFVTGESHAGKYAPAISYHIMKQNPTAQLKINLKGLAIGNGFCDPENQLGFSEYLYHLGLIDSNGKKLMEAKVNEVTDLIRQEKWDDAYVSINELIDGNAGELTLFTKLTGFTNYYNILDINNTVSDNMRKYVDLARFRAALHVGKIMFDDGRKVLNALSTDYLQSSTHHLTELLENYKVLFYNGQFDIVLAPQVQINFLHKLKFKDSEAYKLAERHIWKIDGDVAGYVKEAGNIMEIMDLIIHLVNVRKPNCKIVHNNEVSTIGADLECKLKSTAPLILTPCVENGDIEKAQKLAEVQYEEAGDVKSYAGYFTVSKLYNSNLFFWFFPSETDYKNAPVVLWLQGGPGASSLLGALVINGAFEITDELKLKRKSYYWSQKHSVLYIDNPVGTGFSFTDDDGYTRNQTIVAEHLYSALLQFFQLFPELQRNDFYATGESHAGKYVPAISEYIMMQNPIAHQKINLKGLAIGNGACDPENQMGFSELLYQIGLIDLHGKVLIQTKVDEVIELMRKDLWDDAYVAANKLIHGDCDEQTLFTNLTGFTNYYNILDINDTAHDNMRKYVRDPKFRFALHVGNITFDDGKKVLAAMKTDFLKPSIRELSKLLDHYKVLFYNGQFDILLAYPYTANFLQKLQFKDSEAYKSAMRHIWMIDGDVAGYVKEAGNLMEVMIRNAGHMVPMHQPKWALDMITRFTHNQSFY